MKKIIFVFILLLAFLAAVVVMWSSIDKVIRGEQPPRGAVAAPPAESRAALTGAPHRVHAEDAAKLRPSGPSSC
jgi:hypothetical protein